MGRFVCCMFECFSEMNFVSQCISMWASYARSEAVIARVRMYVRVLVIFGIGLGIGFGTPIDIDAQEASRAGDPKPAVVVQELNKIGRAHV